MFSVILYTLRQTVDNRAPLLLLPSFFPSYCDVSYALSYFAYIIHDSSGSHDGKYEDDTSGILRLAVSLKLTNLFGQLLREYTAQEPRRLTASQHRILIP
jgi:hypothetical protein